MSSLGAGGMGEVYRARDSKLQRDVAIKVLPELVATDPDRLSRFEREARLLASLNHPNIASIYGVEDTTSVRALVLELVEGPTLAEIVASGSRLPLGEAIDIARQIAVGLEAAHDRGIIHRDLKPANIKRAPDGTVKILDFGLAKALHGDPAVADVSQSPTVTGGTRGGVILGTAAYMSPEQARGQPLDERTDIWAFGCIVYEMLAGRLAFAGPTASDILVRILSGEPDWTAVGAPTPAPLRTLIRRCLEKDRKRRLHSIGDARIEIEDLRSAPAEQPAPHGARWRDRFWWLGWGTAAMTIAAASVLVFRPPAAGAPPVTLDGATPESLTFDIGLSTTPAISPDGRLVAYASDRAGRGDLDIWLQQISGGAPLRLTTDPADDQSPDFSRDGSQIVFRSARSGGGVYLVSTLGGEPRLLAAEGRSPRFSPDGSRVAYWVGPARGGGTAASATFVIALGGGTPVRLLADFEVARDPAWSPDGRSLLVAAQRSRDETGSDLDWWIAPMDGTAARRTLAARLPPVKAALTADRPGYLWRNASILFSDGRSLWALPAMADGSVTSPPRRITLGVENLRYPSESRDGRMVFASEISTRAIERVPLSNNEPTAAPARIYSDNRPGAGRPGETADGFTLVVSRGREIWLRDVRTATERLVVRVDGRSEIDATIAPDGSRIGYAVDVTGYVIETAGGVPRRVCERCAVHGFLSDNRRVLVGPSAGGGALRVVDATTGRSSDIVLSEPQDFLNRPHASPNDRWLAFRREVHNVGKTFVVPLMPGKPPPPNTWAQVDEPTAAGRACGWSADSRVLDLLLDTDGFRCLWAQRVDDAGRLVGKPYAVRHFHSANESNFGTSYGNAITAEGLLIDAVRQTGNIWTLAPPR